MHGHSFWVLGSGIGDFLELELQAKHEKEEEGKSGREGKKHREIEGGEEEERTGRQHAGRDSPTQGGTMKMEAQGEEAVGGQAPRPRAVRSPLLNLRNPRRADTVTLPAGGWVYMRFVANNPGLWPQATTKDRLGNSWTLLSSNLHYILVLPRWIADMIEKDRKITKERERAQV